MKKYLSITIMLVLVFALSISAGASYYEETNTTYDYVIKDANIINTGNVMEYELGFSEAPSTHTIEGLYYFNEKSYVSFRKQFDENNDSLSDDLGMELGYEFYNKNDWILTGLVERRSDSKFITHLRTSKKINDKLTLNNNFKILFDDDLFKNLRTGLTYKANNKNNLKLSIGRLNNSYVLELDRLFEDLYFQGSFETKVNDDFNNIVTVQNYFNIDNMNIIEEIEYTGWENIYLGAYFVVRTESDNSLGVESKTNVKEDFYLTFDYYNFLGDSDNYSGSVGAQYEF